MRDPFIMEISNYALKDLEPHHRARFVADVFIRYWSEFRTISNLCIISRAELDLLLRNQKDESSR